MLAIREKHLTYSAKKCCQCGICLSVCPVQALSVSEGSLSFQIKIDRDKCIGCGKCADFCPAANAYNTSCPTSEVLESIESGFLAWAKDDSVRRLASSGGVCRTIIDRVLNGQQYDAVYSLEYPAVEPNGHPLKEAAGLWLTDPVAQKQIPCSLYRPVMWGANLSNIERNWKKLLLIGLPCQVRGAKKMINQLFPFIELTTVTILCRKQKNFGHSRYLARYFGTPHAPREAVFYRGNGWPGKSGVWGESGRKEIPFFYYAKCWNLTGCSFCMDCLNAGVTDLTVADPWGVVSADQDPSGSNLVIAWTPKGNDLFKSAVEELACMPLRKEQLLEALDFPQINRKSLAKQMPVWRKTISFCGQRLGEIVLMRFHHDSPILKLQYILKRNLKKMCK